MTTPQPGTAVAVSPTHRPAAVEPLYYTDLAGMVAFAVLMGGEARKQEICRKLVAGHVLGLTPGESLQHVHVISGRPEVSGEFMAKRIRESGVYDYRVVQLTDDVCTIELTARGAVVATESFTFDMATRAGITHDNAGKIKPVWDVWRRNMLFYRCISVLKRLYCPDILSGAYVEGEIQYGPDEPAEPRNITPSSPMPVVDLSIAEAESAELWADIVRLTPAQGVSVRNAMTQLGISVTRASEILLLSRNTFHTLKILVQSTLETPL